MNAAYIEAFAPYGDHRPARTAIGVAALPKAGAVVTMGLTAVASRSSDPTARRPAADRRPQSVGGRPNSGNSAAPNVVISATIPPSNRTTSSLKPRNDVSPGALR